MSQFRMSFIMAGAALFVGNLALRAQDDVYTLGFSGPELLDGFAGDPVSGVFMSTLSHTGSGLGAEGWAISMSAQNAVITSIGIAGSDAEALFNGGFEKSEVTSDASSAGPAEDGCAGRDGAISAVILAFQSPVVVAPNTTATIAVIGVDKTIAEGGGTITLEYVNGCRGTGQKVKNTIIQSGATGTPVLTSKEVECIEIPDCCKKPISYGFSAGRIQSDTPHDPTFERDVQPILHRSCGGCHIDGARSGVELTSHKTTLASIGRRYESPIVIPGDPDLSPLMDKIASIEPQFGSRMPKGRDPLSDSEIDIIRNWIADGAAGRQHSGLADATETCLGSGAEIRLDPGQADVYLNIISDFPEGAPSIQGWSASVGVDGVAVAGATTVDTAGAATPDGYSDGGFEKTEVVDPANNPNSGPLSGAPQGRGVVSAVVLSFTMPNTLPGQGVESILAVTLEGADGDSGSVSMRNGLQGVGQPVLNVATVSGGTRIGCNIAEVNVAFRPPPGIGPYSSGDANGDAKDDIADGIWILQGLFYGGPVSACQIAADANKDGSIDVSDAAYILDYQFLGGPPPVPPSVDGDGDGCGVEPAADAVFDCESPTCS